MTKKYKPKTKTQKKNVECVKNSTKQCDWINHTFDKKCGCGCGEKIYKTERCEVKFLWKNAPTKEKTNQGKTYCSFHQKKHNQIIKNYKILLAKLIEENTEIGKIKELLADMSDEYGKIAYWKDEYFDEFTEQLKLSLHQKEQ